MGMDTILAQIRTQAAARALRITDHAREEMEEESITLAEVLEAIAVGQIIENYPDHRRGSCCLLYGLTNQRRSLHVVCTTSLPLLVIITVYIPTPPKWINPIERSSR
jgi:Domain of unknown function (DUF4258)